MTNATFFEIIEVLDDVHNSCIQHVWMYLQNYLMDGVFHFLNTEGKEWRTYDLKYPIYPIYLSIPSATYEYVRESNVLND